MTGEKVIAPTLLRRHRVAGVCALVLSLGLHAALWNRLPPMQWGGLADLPAFPDFPSIQMDRVQAEPEVAERPTPRFRAENPADVREVWSDAIWAAALPAAGLPIPEQPEVSTGPVKGEAESLAEPPAIAAAAAWDPRQEILQIEQPVLDDHAAALPRRLTAATPRADRVPDVVLPVEPSAPWAAYPAAGLPAGIESLSRPMREIDGSPGWSAGAGLENPGMMASAPPPVDSLPPPLRESEQEIKPVEQHLQLALRTFRAEDEPEWVYVEIQILRRDEKALPVLPKDLLLVQDCSESMTPWKLAECKRGLRRWLDMLNEKDRFDVMAFRDTVDRCFGAWAPFTASNKAVALRFVDELRAQGNTDVYGSLQEALHVERRAGRPVLMALITDGLPTTGITSPPAIVEGFTSANEGHISVFGLGGGKKVNRFLLDLLSYRNRGDSLVVEEAEEIPYAMERWGVETRRPVLTDLSYRFSGAATDAIYPTTLTHLYLDRPLTLYGRIPAEGPELAFQIIGRSGSTERDMVFPLELATAASGAANLRTRWVWHRIYDRIGQYLREPDEAIRREVQDLAHRYGLAVPYGFGTAVPRW